MKGFTSPDPMQLDLMRTWSATPRQVFWKLRWPAAVPFLFTSLKVAITISAGRRHRRRAADRRRGRHRRAAAGRLLLWPDHPDLGGAGRVALLASGPRSRLVGLTERGVARRMGAAADGSREARIAAFSLPQRCRGCPALAAAAVGAAAAVRNPVCGRPSPLPASLFVLAAWMRRRPRRRGRHRRRHLLAAVASLVLLHDPAIAGSARAGFG